MRIAFIVALWFFVGGVGLAAPTQEATAVAVISVSHPDGDSSGGMACGLCASACPTAGCVLSGSAPFGVLRAADGISMDSSSPGGYGARAPDTAPPKRISA